MTYKNRQTKILFIADKWCGGNKKYGISEWEKGVQDSLESTKLANCDVFHFDDYYFTTGERGDEAALQKIAEYQPDIIFLITNKMPGTTFNVLNWSTLKKIKEDFKIPIVAMWIDFAVAEQVKISLAILPYVKLIFSAELTAALARINRSDKYIYIWAPRDPRIFNNPNKQRDIDVCYFGSPRKDRLSVIRYLQNNSVRVIYGGGEGQEHLTTEQYAEKYQKSKIALSFSRSKSSHVINARPFEVMLCGAMLLEQESFELMKLYTPYVDYVPYTNKRDLLKKTKYYLTHDKERQKIARSGQKKTDEIYNAKIFWQIVIDKTLNGESKEEFKFEYAIPPENLALLSPITAFKMNFLNHLCATKTGFMIYKIFNSLYWKDNFYFAIGQSRVLSEKLLPKTVFDFILKLKHKIIGSH